MTVIKVRIRWTADRSRIAHASIGTDPRALCGEPAVDERFAWRPLRKCMACEALAQERGL